MSVLRPVRGVLAFAGLRMRQGAAARLGLLVPIGFAVGLAAALWAPGADLATRAATADRAALGAVGALAVLAALVIGATTLPAEIRAGSADRLFGAPVARAALVAGSVLGHGVFASLVLAGGVAAALLGIEAGGLGTGARQPTRAFTSANPDREIRVLREAPVADVPLAIAPRALPDDQLVVRLRPRAVNEGGEMERVTRVPLSLSQRGGERTVVVAGWAPGREVVARFPADGLEPGLPLLLTIERPAGTWGLVLAPGTIETGGPPRLFLATALKAAACLAPVLFLCAAAGALGAARFGAPTALGVALFLLVAFAGQDVLREGAAFVVRTAEKARATAAEGHHEHDGHDHGDHEHAPEEVSGLQEALARGALAGLSLLPPLDAFDRTPDVLAGRDVPLREGGRAALLALPGMAVLAGAAWLLLARRDVLPL